MKHEQEIKKLIIAMKETESTRLYEIYLAVRLHLEGRTLTEIAKIFGMSFPAINGYWNDYLKQGLRLGIWPVQFGSFPTKRRTAERNDCRPKTCGCWIRGQVYWSLRIIRAWILREFGEKYTLKGISKMLNRLGFSYTKATYTPVRNRNNSAKSLC
ncbi:winged helix-turn-helix domain-containing protein [Paenibacillus sp. FSL E2-0178]|uniref:helix-turn-helix domain-containing protein n=1 Tax=Paenibacillus sp. FSL E2-0178 TaxID=2921361 RepID=UPI0031585E31